MINVTQEAQEHLLKASQENDNQYPRLAIIGTGCSGYQYGWYFADPDNLVPGDEIIDLENGCKLVIDDVSFMYLYGATITIEKDEFGSTLEVSNPQSDECGGCPSNASIKSCGP